MNKSQNNKFTIDDQLADFTDDILSKKAVNIDESSFDSDPELRALEQTALRLKNAFQEGGPSEIVIQRMHKNVIAQWQQQKIQKSKPFWKNWIPVRQKWQSQRSRQYQRLVLYLAMLAALMVISIPRLTGTGANQPATSGQNLDFTLIVISGGLLILLVVLFFERKR